MTRHPAAVAALVLAAQGALAETTVPAEMPVPVVVPVQKLAAAPVVDGDLSDWGGNWLRVPVQPAIENDRQNRVGDSEVELQYGVHGDRLYLAARWADKSESRDYKPWVWSKARRRYKRGRERDDMFAQRFDMAGDFNSCMIAKANYDVDVWLWSAGRSDPAGLAMDMWHRITTEPVDSAAEYETDGGTVVYIIKRPDDGVPPYKNARVKRKKYAGDRVPGVKLSKEARGSVADVSARGTWKDGYWTLEMSRALSTGNPDDVDLSGRERIRGQVAVFDQGFAEHKSVSGIVELDFSSLR